ncbi:hypothetical protein TGVAND_259835 [Toxoplasma gondii VAND]|uniref:Uncharacterized protein n=1 Tax=Toxoplasma gondii VAND TaxID=933077 RepID=A0A086QE14_TOXGO|nr:hypothetical protein TGVAND_259835 [Toxoplasma gondii VAND]
MLPSSARLTLRVFAYRCPRWHVEASRSLGLVTFRARSNRRRGRFFLSLDVLPELRDRILNFKKSQSKDGTAPHFFPPVLSAVCKNSRGSPEAFLLTRDVRERCCHISSRRTRHLLKLSCQSLSFR